MPFKHEKYTSFVFGHVKCMREKKILGQEELTRERKGRHDESKSSGKPRYADQVVPHFEQLCNHDHDGHRDHGRNLPILSAKS